MTMVVTSYSGLPNAIGTAFVFKPPMNPDQGVSVSTAPSLNAFGFGDGYVQVVPNGINSIRRQISVSWSLLSPGQRALILSFFEARGGYEPFWFGLPGQVMRLWRCPRWQEAEIGYEIYRVNAEFVEDFSPVI